MDSARSHRVCLALRRATEALNRSAHLDTLLVDVLEAAREAIPAADKGSILFWDEVFQTHVSHTVGYADVRALKATFELAPGAIRRGSSCATRATAPSARCGTSSTCPSCALGGPRHPS